MGNFKNLIDSLKERLEANKDINIIRSILDAIRDKESKYLDNNYNIFMKTQREFGIGGNWKTKFEHETLIKNQEMLENDFFNNKRDMRILDKGINSLYKELLPYISDKYNNALVKIDNFNYEFNLNISGSQNLLEQKYILFTDSILDYKENLSYSKTISNHKFIIHFTHEKNENISEIEFLVLRNTNDDEFSVKIQMIPEVKINSIFNSKTSFIFNNKNKSFENNYLNTLNIQDLLRLDSKEYNEIHLISTDIPFNFKSDELYEIFKIGFSEFINVLEKELKNKKIINKKNYN